MSGVEKMDPRTLDCGTLCGIKYFYIFNDTWPKR